MDSAKTQLADRLKSANNILVTVSRDPSIDQLAACLGLTLLLNKMNKHSVAVFSGQVPSTLEFLKPDATIEKTTDSLRDFIISLDKDKADKLRYKVEDNVVRIFITPYKTSISQEDLEFSQGDFNVDVVVALGVKQQQDLDQAITAHGRILHDATLASVNLSPDGGLGTINWHDAQASSLSELVTDLSQMLGDNLLDNQVATALLTGIVAETDRFSNDKTSSQTMNASSLLMAAGANQQLVATKLEEPAQPQPPAAKQPADNKNAKPGKGKQDPSTLNISHDEGKQKETKKPAPPKPKPAPAAKPEPTPPAPAAPQLPTPQPPLGSSLQPGAKLLTDYAPSLGGTLNANTKPEGLDPVTDPMSMPQKEDDRLFGRSTPPPPEPVTLPPAPAFTPPPAAPAPPALTTPSPEPAAPAVPAPPPQPVTPPPPAKPAPMPAPTPKPSAPEPSSPPSPSPTSDKKETLSQLEKSVNSSHMDKDQLETARDEVSQALQDSVSPTPPPIQALNAQPLGGSIHEDKPKPTIQPSSSSVLPFDNTPEPSESEQTDSLDRPSGAPPVPPPFTPQSTGNPFDNSDSKTPPL